MLNYLKNLLPRLERYNKSLDNLELLIDQPWVQMEENGDVHKYIFLRSGELIISVKGEAIIGSWKYISSSCSLILITGSEAMLLNQVFVNEGLMILRKDGNSSSSWMLINESILPDLDIIKYLQSITPQGENVILIDSSTSEISFKYLSNGWSSEMGKFKEFQVRIGDGFVRRAFQRELDGLYYYWTGSELRVFLTPDECIKYLKELAS